jgi:cytochrome c-type biogenesis protein
VVPSYLAFVSGLSLEELRDGSRAGARRAAFLHSLLFVAGFAAVFMTMGWTASAFGQAVGRALPWLTRFGGVVVMALGLYLAGVWKIGPLNREVRVQLNRKPAGAAGTFVVGIAFGAGWTPCIGPVLASILLYTSLEGTATHGALLLGTYAVGLGIPFVIASLALNAFLAGTEALRRWVVPLERTAGAVLVLVGLLMVTGRFASLTASLAGLGQLIDLETP